MQAPKLCYHHCSSFVSDTLQEAKKKAKKGAETSDIETASSDVEKLNRRERAKVSLALDDVCEIPVKQSRGSHSKKLTQNKGCTSSKASAALKPPPKPPSFLGIGLQQMKKSNCGNSSQNSYVPEFSQLRKCNGYPSGQQVGQASGEHTGQYDVQLGGQYDGQRGGQYDGQLVVSPTSSFIQRPSNPSDGIRRGYYVHFFEDLNIYSTEIIRQK